MNPRERGCQPIRVCQAEQVFDDIPGANGGGRAPRLDTYVLRVANSVQEVEKLRPLWNTWPHNLETDFDYYLHSVKNDPTTLCPYVITVFQDGIAQAMLIGRVKTQKMSAVVSFLRVPGPKVNVLEIAPGGRLGQESSAIDKLLASELSKQSDGGKVDLLCFLRLPLDSQLFHEVQQLPGLLVKARVPYVFCYSVLSLSSSHGRPPAAFSRKNEHEIRRKTRILQRAFPDQSSFKCFSSLTEVDDGLRAAAAVALTTWQYYLGFGFSRTPQMGGRLRFCAEKGWLRIYVMYIERRPCAFLLGQLYNGTFYCQHAGYDPEFARFSVGTLLTSWALKHLRAVGVGQVDLGEGDQEHNRRIGCEMCEEGTVHLYSRTPRAFCASVFFASTRIIRVGGRKTLAGLRLDWILAIWRQLLLSWWKRQKQASEQVRTGTKSDDSRLTVST